MQIKIESAVAEKIREGVDRAALLSNIQRFSKITDLIGELSMTSLRTMRAHIVMCIFAAVLCSLTPVKPS